MVRMDTMKHTCKDRDHTPFLYWKIDALSCRYDVDRIAVKFPPFEGCLVDPPLSVPAQQRMSQVVLDWCHGRHMWA